MSSLQLSVFPSRYSRPSLLGMNFSRIWFVPAFVCSDELLLRCNRGFNSRVHSTANDGEVADINNGVSGPAEQDCAERDEHDQLARAPTLNEVLNKLKRYGVSGVLSYGLLNTVYYLTAFLFVWFYIAPAPGKMGYFAAVERFLKIMALVWAGSQVTKIIRAGGALALAPFVDGGLSWFTIRFSLESRGKAFALIAGFCFGLALVLFLVMTLLWA